VIYRLWERFTLYLPVALMAVLALISYWLVRTAPGDTAPQSVALYDNAPDYYLHAFSAQSFDLNGKLAREIQGAVGRHFPDTKWTEIEDFHGQSYGEGGAVMLAQARRSLTNEEATEMQLMGSAQVLRPELQMAGQALRQRAVYRPAQFDQRRGNRNAIDGFGASAAARVANGGASAASARVVPQRIPACFHRNRPRQVPSAGRG